MRYQKRHETTNDIKMKSATVKIDIKRVIKKKKKKEEETETARIRKRHDSEKCSRT